MLTCTRAAARQAEGPHGGRAHGGGHPPGPVEVGLGQPHVVGDEDGPGARRSGAGGGVGGVGPGVGRRGRRRPAAAPRAATARARSGSTAPPAPAPAHRAKASRAATASAMRGAGEGHEGHHVDHAESGVDAGVGAQVEAGHGGAGARARGRLLADEGEDAAVVVGIVVAVEEVGARRRRPARRAPPRPGPRSRSRRIPTWPSWLLLPGRSGCSGRRCYRPRMLAFLEGPELIIVLVIVLLVFGGSQLPKLARSLGQAQKEFKSGPRRRQQGRRHHHEGRLDQQVTFRR